MTENKRFTIEEWDIWDYADSILVIFKDGEFISNKDVVDLLNELATKCSKLEKENEQLKKLNEKSNNTRALLNDELRGLFQGYIIQCRSISEEAIITMIKRDVKKIVFEVFGE